jgi:drug/metabolite transporter (DMT)-like permease
MQGLLWCFTFVILEAIQAVFFGGLFQRMDSFLVGGLIFGMSTLGGLAWVYARRRSQLTLALKHWQALLGLNVTAALSWIAYLLAIQLIEPAVAFAIFSGTLPLTGLAAAWLKVPYATPARSSVEVWGNLLIGVGVTALSVTTVAGLSGFVRGDVLVALFGIVLAVASGVISMAMLLFCYRMNHVGVEPLAQFSLRFPLYIVLSFAGYAVGLDHKEAVPFSDIAFAVGIGLVIMAFPLYAVQKAVALVPPITIGAVTALGPLFVFALQFVEDRVDYAPATLLGLFVYFAGALLATYGSARRGGPPAVAARTGERPLERA